MLPRQRPCVSVSFSFSLSFSPVHLVSLRTVSACVRVERQSGRETERARRARNTAQRGLCGTKVVAREEREGEREKERKCCQEQERARRLRQESHEGAPRLSLSLCERPSFQVAREIARSRIPTSLLIDSWSSSAARRAQASERQETSNCYTRSSRRSRRSLAFTPASERREGERE